MNEHRHTWSNVFHKYNQITMSRVYDLEGGARIPVSGGSGIDVAGIGIAGFSSSFTICSSEYGGGDSGVGGFFLLYSGGGPMSSAS